MKREGKTEKREEGGRRGRGGEEMRTRKRNRGSITNAGLGYELIILVCVPSCTRVAFAVYAGTQGTSC